MKKSILSLATSVLIAGAFLTSSSTSSEKVENAQNNVKEANKDLDKANEEYLKDVENYKKETADKVISNDQIIAELKTKLKHEKKAAKAEYKRKVDELEQKNSEMKKKMDDYKTEGKEKWEFVKADFNKGMDEIGKSLKDLTSSKTK